MSLMLPLIFSKLKIIQKCHVPKNPSARKLSPNHPLNTGKISMPGLISGKLRKYSLGMRIMSVRDHIRISAFAGH